MGTLSLENVLNCWAKFRPQTCLLSNTSMRKPVISSFRGPDRGLLYNCFLAVLKADVLPSNHKEILWYSLPTTTKADVVIWAQYQSKSQVWDMESDIPGSLDLSELMISQGFELPWDHRNASVLPPKLHTYFCELKSGSYNNAYMFQEIQRINKQMTTKPIVDYFQRVCDATIMHVPLTWGCC